MVGEEKDDDNKSKALPEFVLPATCAIGSNGKYRRLITFKATLFGGISVK